MSDPVSGLDITGINKVTLFIPQRTPICGEDSHGNRSMLQMVCESIVQ